MACIRSGHLFQGRYKGILVDTDGYMQELARYVVLNPVRAGMVVDPDDWVWSRYRATSGLERCPVWLSTEFLLSTFAAKKGEARSSYKAFVREGIGEKSVWEKLNKQIYLGDDVFVERMQRHLEDGSEDVQIPKLQQRKPPPSLDRHPRG